MRRVVIQIFCVYLSLFYLVVGLISLNYPMSKFLLMSSLLCFIVSMKIIMYKKSTNMLYNTLFMFLCFVINYMLIKNFTQINTDTMSQYLFKTIPNILKQTILILNLSVIVLTSIEYLNSRKAD